MARTQFLSMDISELGLDYDLDVTINNSCRYTQKRFIAFNQDLTICPYLEKQARCPDLDVLKLSFNCMQIWKMI